MKLRTLTLLFVLAVVSIQGLAQGFGTLPSDPAIRKGTLDNGLTYYIRQNNWPEHRAYFYIAQRVGAIQEEESQRGLAHFLEHMAFNGSDNFKGNGLIEYLRSLGVEFGSDLNAYTAIDRTVYNIDNVPTTRQSALDSCLLILRDWSCGLTLDPKEIDQERGVIHEEWRMRTSASSRLFERNLPALYPGSKYGVRFPIGLMSVVDNFKYKELRDYYEKWYHPSNQAIIVVGDIDLDHTEAQIKKLFGGIKNPANAAPVLKEAVPDNAEPIVIIDKDKEMQTSEIDFMLKHDVYPDSLKNSPMFLVYEYIRDAAMSMLRLRFDEAAQKPDCPYVSASASDGSYIFASTRDAFSLSATPKDMSKTAASLKAVIVEARRAAQFGFTATEYERYKDQYLAALEKQYTNRDKQNSEGLVNRCVSNYLDEEPMLSLEQRYEMMKQMVPMLPVDAVNQYMKELFTDNDSNVVIVNFNNEADGNFYPTKDELIGALRDARKTEIQAFVDNVKNEPLITKLPKAGKIVKETSDAVLGTKELTLSNGVKVVLKKTDYKADQVILDAWGPGGSAYYPDKDALNAENFNTLIGISGLGNFSSTELRKALAGKMTNADLSMTEQIMNLSGQSTPKDLETLFQLSYLYLTNIKKDTEQYNNLMQQLEVQLKNRDLAPEVSFSDSLTMTLFNHSPRRMPLTVNNLKDINYDRVLAMAREMTASLRGWTFTFVGNFDEEAIRPLICQYIASLPTKGKALEGKHIVKKFTGTVDNIYTRKMETPKALAVVYWYNDKLPATIENHVQTTIVGDLLTMVYLKKIREEASAAYSVGANGGLRITKEGPSYTIVVQCPVKPEKKDLALQIIYDELSNLANNVDEEMLAKVKASMAKNFDTSLKTNGYWSNAIYLQKAFNYDSYSRRKAVVEAQTPETIKAFVKKLMNGINRATVMMLPQE